MRRVILESPYRGGGHWPMSWWRRLQNIRYARAAVRHSLTLGEAPIASHLLYTQPGILDDDNAAERAWGIDAGLAWGAVADATVVYSDRGISQGMVWGVQNAHREGRPVEWRTIQPPARRAGASQAGDEHAAQDEIPE